MSKKKKTRASINNDEGTRNRGCLCVLGGGVQETEKELSRTKPLISQDPKDPRPKTLTPLGRNQAAKHGMAWACSRKARQRNNNSRLLFPGTGAPPQPNAYETVQDVSQLPRLIIAGRWVG